MPIGWMSIILVFVIFLAVIVVRKLFPQGKTDSLSSLEIPTRDRQSALKPRDRLKHDPS